MDIVLARTLARWAHCNTNRQEQLETWLDDAITAIAAGKGSSVISTTANGIAVSFSTRSLTNGEWAATLSRALEMISTGNTTSRAVGIIR